MKKCPNCGAKVGENVAFCSVCGNALQNGKNKVITLILIFIAVLLVVVISFFIWNHSRVMGTYTAESSEPADRTEVKEPREETESTFNLLQKTATCETTEAPVQVEMNRSLSEYVLEGSDRRYIRPQELQSLNKEWADFQ